MTEENIKENSAESTEENSLLLHKKLFKNGKNLFRQKSSRTSLTLMFAFSAFIVLLSALIIVTALVLILVNTGVFSDSDGIVASGNTIIAIMFATSIVTGAAWAMFFGNLFTKPINQVINMMNRLASGDFKARINPKGKLKRFPVVEELTNSMNVMAAELDKTEILRSDFVNNFSHEFKTPIVSISGFAKLLDEGNLTEEEKKEYIKIIKEESLRLAGMATKTLELTKLENQTILSDIAEYNLSEQIRNCFLLLENKWEEKQLDFSLDFDEYDIMANEAMLYEVWINLLDNAIKFTPFGGTVSVDIAENDGMYTVRVTNTGSTVSEEDKERIFRKFYQADTSHATQGNGIGLAVVKKIVDLHRGEISVESADDVTTFIVELPEIQNF